MDGVYELLAWFVAIPMKMGQDNPKILIFLVICFLILLVVGILDDRKVNRHYYGDK